MLSLTFIATPGYITFVGLHCNTTLCYLGGLGTIKPFQLESKEVLWSMVALLVPLPHKLWPKLDRPLVFNGHHFLAQLQLSSTFRAFCCSSLMAKILNSRAPWKNARFHGCGIRKSVGPSRDLRGKFTLLRAVVSGRYHCRGYIRLHFTLSRLSLQAQKLETFFFNEKVQILYHNSVAKGKFCGCRMT